MILIDGCRGRRPQLKRPTDGGVWNDALCFVDDGCSGNTLLRPALERLRDAVANGLFDRLYVHAPDRLARRNAYQVLLVDELRRAVRN